MLPIYLVGLVLFSVLLYGAYRKALKEHEKNQSRVVNLFRERRGATTAGSD